MLEEDLWDEAIRFATKHRVIKTVIIGIAIFSIDNWYNKQVYNPLFLERFKTE